MKIGIIAEDDSDVKVISQLTLTLLRPHSIGFKKFVGDGCGKLRRKCGPWALNLVQQGCRWIVVLHDLDLYDEVGLRNLLTDAVTGAGAVAYVVLIPKREIEAWLLYDAKALAQAFNESTSLRLPREPEDVDDPKAYIRDIIWRRYRKRYLHTVHNSSIAKFIDVRLLRRSLSFGPHFGFVNKVKDSLGDRGHPPRGATPR